MENIVSRIIVATVLAVIFAGLVAACVSTITFKSADSKESHHLELVGSSHEVVDNKYSFY